MSKCGRQNLQRHKRKKNCGAEEYAGKLQYLVSGSRSQFVKLTEGRL